MISSDRIIQAVYWLDKYRKKIIFMLLLPVVVACFAYFCSDYVVEILAKPLGGMNLFFITPMDGVMIKVKIAIFISLIITLPILAYMALKLVVSKIHKKTEKTIKFLLIPFVTLAFLGGMFFGYKLVIPSTIKFLISCGNDFMSANLRGSDYFSFIIMLLVSIGLVFELPIVLVALSRIGLITSKKLMKKRKIAIFVIIIFVALITPTPDVFTLMVVSLPMIILFEISIWWIFLLEKGHRKNG